MDGTVGASISGGGDPAMIPLLGRVIDPWSALRNYNTSQASQFAPAQARAEVGLTQARAAESTAQSGLLGQQAIDRKSTRLNSSHRR